MQMNIKWILITGEAETPKKKKKKEKKAEEETTVTPAEEVRGGMMNSSLVDLWKSLISHIGSFFIIIQDQLI